LYIAAPPPHNLETLWYQTIEPSLNLLKSYVVDSKVTINNTCDAATLIYDIYDMSETFEHEGQAYNFSTQAKALIACL